MPHLSAISIYPVKSLGGIALPCARVTPRGLKHDRRFLLVDANGNFLTQRQLPHMAGLQTRLINQELEIDGAGQAMLQVPLVPHGHEIEVNIWGDRVAAIAVGEICDAWLGEALGISCRLVWMPEKSRRLVDPNFAKQGEITSFSDGFPFLLTSETSLADLNARLDEPVPAERFRANLQVAGTHAWDEDNWKRLRIGNLEWENLKPCARCVVTTIDQQSGARDGVEPLRTLSMFRNRVGGVMFGLNLVAHSFGTIRVGDEIEILERF